MSWMFDNVGRLIARLQKPASRSEPFTQNDPKALATPFDAVTFYWSREKVTFPAASNISLNQHGRIRHCTSGRWRAPQPEASPTS